jgi:hypothetical protein
MFFFTSAVEHSSGICCELWEGWHKFWNKTAVRKCKTNSVPHGDLKYVYEFYVSVLSGLSLSGEVQNSS